MQILKDNSKKSGDIVVQLESIEDLWVLYNILKPGDFMKGKTNRRVVIREGDTGRRQSMTLKIEIKKIEFHEFTTKLRVLGQIVDGPKDLISIGDHHTFNLEPGKKYRIFKEKWYKNDVERIRRCISRSQSSIVLCVAIETGLANIALLSDYSLTPVSEVKVNIPGKRYGKQQYDKTVDKFFNNVKIIVEENAERNKVLLIVICGPGFTKEEFSNYLKENGEFIKQNNVPIRDLNASSGEISGIYETIRNGSISTQKSDFRFVKEAEYLSKFIEHLGKEDGLAMYGIKETKNAAISGAIEHLLVCDSLLRTADGEIREDLEESLNNTELQGGKVHILSTRSPPGEQLESYGKIAAILRFRIE